MPLGDVFHSITEISIRGGESAHGRGYGCADEASENAGAGSGSVDGGIVNGSF